MVRLQVKTAITSLQGHRMGEYGPNVGCIDCADHSKCFMTDKKITLHCFYMYAVFLSKMFYMLIVNL